MMDTRGTDKTDGLVVSETPEDVAVLYSWANLHGAKYRDFSASRREYRAQLRHRAAQQVREQALLAQAEAEAAAVAADSAERRAVEAARIFQTDDSDSSAQRSLREAEEAARTAAAERVEAARRAEAAAVAEAAARREEQEIDEAHASAQRQAARYTDSEIRHKVSAGFPTNTSLPGEMSDPHIAHTQPPEVELQGESQSEPLYSGQPAPFEERRLNSGSFKSDHTEHSSASIPSEQHVSSQQISSRRLRGYRPDDASGVRQIYRGSEPEYDAPNTEQSTTEPVRHFIPVPRTALAAASQDMKPTTEQPTPTQRSSSLTGDAQPLSPGQRHTYAQQGVPPSQGGSDPTSAAGGPESRQPALADRSQPPGDPLSNTQETSDTPPAGAAASRHSSVRPTAPLSSTPTRPVSPFSQALVPSDSTRGRRAQDDFDYQQSQGFPERERRRSTPEPTSDPADSGHRAAYVADPAGPAWLYAPPASAVAPRPITFQPPPPQSSVADTLQQSRERVAARWFALKGVFEQPGQELPEAPPVRQKETRTPVLAVFSLAGGVGKTSLVATVGRALSSMGEKVLLTDTTSHGLLPFYFGASELRQGTVRTFSPPSGSTDAPIYLVSYDVDQTGGDEAAQDLLAEDIINNSRGTHRILLDLTGGSSWIVRRLFRMNPTILVPVAPDMNSVISLQTVEKFFHGINDGDGRPLQPFYVLNQFDPSLPLHLDVREVLRRQLGDRLLPFVIRRAPAVSEALAEGMTVVDYAPDAPVAEDYTNVATWLRTVAAPATAGFRNVRWSER
jgi:cellulose synthase operon protein YhjQ